MVYFLTTFLTQLAYRFNGRTAQPLGPTPAPGCDEPTSHVPRCFQRRRLYLHPARPKSEGSACCDSHRFARCINCHRGKRHSRYGVTCGSDCSSLVALPTDFPRYCPPTPKSRG